MSQKPTPLGKPKDMQTEAQPSGKSRCESQCTRHERVNDYVWMKRQLSSWCCSCKNKATEPLVKAVCHQLEVCKTSTRWLRSRVETGKHGFEAEGRAAMSYSTVSQPHDRQPARLFYSFTAFNMATPVTGIRIRGLGSSGTANRLKAVRLSLTRMQG